MADMTQIVEKAKELGQLIAQSEQVKQYAVARAAYEQDVEMQDLQGQFQIHKMSIASLSKQDTPDEERIAAHEDKLREIYDKIMSCPVMTAYQESSMAVEQLMDEINKILNFYMTGETPQGCGGSCATCGGCHQNG